MTKKYLITGVSGFVAYYFLEYLNSIKEDCVVLGIDINLPNYKVNTFSNIQLHFTKNNLLDYSSLETIIVSFQPTYIIHLASLSSVAKSWIEPITSFINNTNIFLNLVEILRKNNIMCRLLSIGSSEEYGNVSLDNIPIKESAPLKPLSPYAIARVSQEMLSQCYVSSYNVDIILTRSFNHIGPRQSDIFVIPSFIKQILMAEQSDRVRLITGNVSIIRDFVDVRDVVKAYYMLLQRGVSGEAYNICSGTGRSLKEIIDIISDLLSIKIEIETDEAKIRPNDNNIIIGDNTKIVKEIGWQPKISLADSLHDIIAHWKYGLEKNENSL
ncbi:MAG: GDP-mannose 4,6-dehydratase [Spirochaetes bacterium]|nr:GDP-mannose 4,6-dehydratase [Spirochaetota bacterium]